MSDIFLSGFELIEKIGEGGMGHVWKARQLSLDRIVAVKLLPSWLSKDPESVRQIVQEARTAAKLKHSGIVQVYDASEDNGNYYFVMEFVNGYNVGEWLKRKRALPVHDALVVVESVVAALDYAWRTAGLIHCDIKPENIMVDQDGTIKVADLGLSLTQDSDLSTPSDEVAGTPGYISPEQVQGEEKLDCRTDIYALGCCLYQMVTGRRPFMELSDSEAMEAQVTSQIPDPRDVVAGIPAPICCLIERMLVKDRDKRLKDWQAVLADLHRVQKGLMPAGVHPQPGESTLKRKILSKGSSKNLNEGNPGEEARRGFPWVAMILIILAGLAAGYFLYYKKLEQKRESVQPVVSVIPSHSAPSLDRVTSTPEGKLKSMEGGGASALPRATLPQTKSDGKTLAATLDEIKLAANDYESRGAYEEGVRWVENYSGKWALETASNRVAIAGELRKKFDELKNDDQWLAFTKEVATLMLSGKYTAARLRVEPAVKDPKFQRHSHELTAMEGILMGVGTLSDRIIETFSKDVGKIVTVGLSRGEFIGKVVEVRDRKVICKTPDGAAQVDIHLEDLSMVERMARLRRVELPEVSLVMGVTAYNDNRQDEALENLGKTGPVLGPILTGVAQEAYAKKMHDELEADPACIAFARVIAQAGIEAQPVDLLKWRQAIDGCQMTPEVAGKVDRTLDGFLMLHGQSSFAENNTELILAFQKACGMALDPDSAKPLSLGGRPGMGGRQRPFRRQSQ